MSLNPAPHLPDTTFESEQGCIKQYAIYFKINEETQRLILIS